MKKIHPIRESLGLTQEQAAVMLGVTRSHWSMYELGKRDLPLPAKERLAEILQFLQTLENKQKRTPQLKPDAAQLARQIRENEYQRLILEKKLAAAEEKHAAQVRLSLLTEFLESRATGAKKKAPLALPGQRKAASKVTHHEALLIDYRHQLALLHHEKELLESQMKR